MSAHKSSNMPGFTITTNQVGESGESYNSHAKNHIRMRHPTLKQPVLDP